MMALKFVQQASCLEPQDYSVEAVAVEGGLQSTHCDSLSALNCVGPRVVEEGSTEMKNPSRTLALHPAFCHADFVLQL